MHHTLHGERRADCSCVFPPRGPEEKVIKPVLVLQRDGCFKTPLVRFPWDFWLLGAKMLSKPSIPFDTTPGVALRHSRPPGVRGGSRPERRGRLTAGSVHGTLPWGGRGFQRKPETLLTCVGRSRVGKRVPKSYQEKPKKMVVCPRPALAAAPPQSPSPSRPQRNSPIPPPTPACPSSTFQYLHRPHPRLWVSIGPVLESPRAAC